MTSNNLPPTATISVYDIESDQNINLTFDEWQQLQSNNSNEITIVNKSGGNYHSKKTLNSEIKIYGPGVWEDLFSVTVVAATTPIKEVSKLAVTGGYHVLNDPLGRFGTKIKNNHNYFCGSNFGSKSYSSRSDFVSRR
jgi:hypothetical protein